jgi:hypothetical protein
MGTYTTSGFNFSKWTGATKEKRTQEKKLFSVLANKHTSSTLCDEYPPPPPWQNILITV